MDMPLAYLGANELATMGASNGQQLAVRPQSASLKDETFPRHRGPSENATGTPAIGLSSCPSHGPTTIDHRVCKDAAR